MAGPIPTTKSLELVLKLVSILSIIFFTILLLVPCQPACARAMTLFSGSKNIIEAQSATICIKNLPDMLVIIASALVVGRANTPSPKSFLPAITILSPLTSSGAKPLALSRFISVSQACLFAKTSPLASHLNDIFPSVRVEKP